MYLILGGMDVSNHVQPDGITRGEIRRTVKSRVTMEGTLYLSQIKKLTYEIRFDPMSETDLQTLFVALEPDYVHMTYKDPVLGYVCKSFVPTIGDLELILEDKDGVSYWSGLVVTMEEQ